MKALQGTLRVSRCFGDFTAGTPDPSSAFIRAAGKIQLPALACPPRPPAGTNIHQGEQMPAIRHLHTWPLPAAQPWLATPECHCPSWY